MHRGRCTYEASAQGAQTTRPPPHNPFARPSNKGALITGRYRSWFCTFALSTLSASMATVILPTLIVAVRPELSLRFNHPVVAQ